MDSQTQQELVQGLRTGKRHAWRQLYAEYGNHVQRRISRLLDHDKEQTAQIMHETLRAAVRSARFIDPNCESLWTWLWIIARKQLDRHSKQYHNIPSSNGKAR